MWTKDVDDRAFLRELTFDIIAAVAPEELSSFTALIDSYFAGPTPPIERSREQGHLTPIAPAVLVAVLNLLLIEIQNAAQYDQTEIVMLALRRLFRQRGLRPYERAELRPSSATGDPELSLCVLLYTRPVAVVVPLSRIAYVAYETASLYGLRPSRADALVPLAVSRLILGQSAFHSSD